MDLRLAPSGMFPGGLNMALDEALAQECGREGWPVCRFYRWVSPTVTAGRSVPSEAAIEAAAAYPDAALFRRPTGGGVLYHGDQMSFCVAWPRRLGALRDLRESYVILHATLQAALADCGVTAILADAAAPDRGLMCASSVERGDLTSPSGNKLAGGAQWRAASAVLYQGHLWLGEIAGLEQAFARRFAALIGTGISQWAIPESAIAAASAREHTWEIIRPALRAAAV